MHMANLFSLSVQLRELSSLPYPAVINACIYLGNFLLYPVVINAFISKLEREFFVQNVRNRGCGSDNFRTVVAVLITLEPWLRL